eukprot:1820276-Amphidinium_carterae.1
MLMVELLHLVAGWDGYRLLEVVICDVIALNRTNAAGVAEWPADANACLPARPKSAHSHEEHGVCTSVWLPPPLARSGNGQIKAEGK